MQLKHVWAGIVADDIQVVFPPHHVIEIDVLDQDGSMIVRRPCHHISRRRHDTTAAPHQDLIRAVTHVGIVCGTIAALQELARR